MKHKILVLVVLVLFTLTACSTPQSLPNAAPAPAPATSGENLETVDINGGGESNSPHTLEEDTSSPPEQEIDLGATGSSPIGPEDLNRGEFHFDSEMGWNIIHDGGYRPADTDSDLPAYTVIRGIANPEMMLPALERSAFVNWDEFFTQHPEQMAYDAILKPPQFYVFFDESGLPFFAVFCSESSPNTLEENRYCKDLAITLHPDFLPAP
ncbi:hypothetical protein KJ953_03840 [Patescibacteria group bacterium]|nr:hypothetical protein [Patescibacteria group bacterium]